MTVLKWICVAILGVSTILCVLKGFGKFILKTIAFVLAIVFAKLIGAWLSRALISELISFKGFSGASKQIGGMLISAVSTFVAFFVLLFILKRIFSIVDRKIEPDIQFAITNVILGALSGLFIGIVFVPTFAKIVVTVLVAASLPKALAETLKHIDNTIIFKFSRNLN